ncbi:MAG TPA: outer membrane beta-barrel protein [Rubricoccaceae bacterium]|nr:outer membrane beta-barrel protein [Rubricoccaceae bacterium]
MVRTLIASVALALFAAAPALAQPRGFPAREPGGLRVSAALGPSFNWLGDVTVVEADSAEQEGQTTEYPVSVGFKGGLMVGYRSGPLGLRVGANFLNTGSIFDGTTFLNEDELSANFVTLAVDAQVVRPVTPFLDLYAFGGPEFRYLLDLSGVSNFEEFRDGFESVSTTASFGAGVRLHLLGYSFGPELRYGLDLGGFSGDTFETEGGGTVRLDEGFSMNNLLFGLVFGR